MENSVSNSVSTSANEMYGRKITVNDLIVEMHCALAKLREGSRVTRLNAYLSIKTDVDKRFMIFLRSSLTNAHYEVLRSIDAYDNKPLRSIAETYIEEHSDTVLFLGRVRYKPINGFVTEQHRKSLKHGLFALWGKDNIWEGELYLNGEYYPISFNDKITTKQKNKGYHLTGEYILDEGEMD